MIFGVVAWLPVISASEYPVRGYGGLSAGQDQAIAGTRAGA
jgi:hypothetical protein